MNETDKSAYLKFRDSISASVPDAAISGPIVEPGSFPRVIGERKSVEVNVESAIDHEVPTAPQELRPTTS